MPRERGGLLECGDTLFSWVFAAKAVWPAGRIKRALVSAATFAMLLQTLVCLRRVKQRPPEHDLVRIGRPGPLFGWIDAVRSSIDGERYSIRSSCRTRPAARFSSGDVLRAGPKFRRRGEVLRSHHLIQMLEKLQLGLEPVTAAR